MSTLLQQRHQPTITPKLRDQIPAQRVAPRGSARPEPTAAVPNRPVEAPRARWLLILDSIVATLREWRRRSVERSELARLDARTLRDIGVDPGVVDYEIRQSFWRPLRICGIDRRGLEPNGHREANDSVAMAARSCHGAP
jgi:uncharacterized protein YjiS (DUF1127 family)